MRRIDELEDLEADAVAGGKESDFYFAECGPVDAEYGCVVSGCGSIGQFVAPESCYVSMG